MVTALTLGFLLKSTVRMLANVPVDPWTIATDWQILMLRSLALERLRTNHWSLAWLDLMLPNIIPELGEQSVTSNRGKATAAMLWPCRKAEKQLGSNYFKRKTFFWITRWASVVFCGFQLPALFTYVGTRLSLMSLYQITPLIQSLGHFRLVTPKSFMGSPHVNKIWQSHLQNSGSVLHCQDLRCLAWHL